MTAVNDAPTTAPPPPARTRRADTNQRVARYGFWVVAAAAIGYAPLAVNYMWRYFVDGTVQVQASVTSAIDGHGYAVGYGSVDWARATAYEHDRWVMLIHTVLGGLCMVLGVMQFLPAVRRRWPRAHRWSGRVFLFAMTVSMLMAMVFLVDAGTVDFSMASAFWLQLWALALGSLATGWLGFAMIRNRNVVAHQGFMMQCFAFLMTAPGLRALWVGLHPVFPRAVLLDNLGAGAVSEAILAPALGAAAFILTRPERAARAAAAPDAASRATYLWCGAVGLVAVAVTVVHGELVLPADFPREILWTYFVPLALAVGTTLAFARRAHRAGRHTEERWWRYLLVGLVANVVLVNLTWVLGAIAVSQADAWLSSLFVTAAIPIVVAGTAIINDASPRPLFARRRVAGATV
ncbi:MAG TPA: DUF2306 domain-containing protein [Nocardioides sp.]|nr:DUF2306 domain-containing protein [Nocardioides sp.]